MIHNLNSLSRLAHLMDELRHEAARTARSQQFGPPQASKTGSLCTEATIAAPVPTASASKTAISAVIFTIPP